MTNRYDETWHRLREWTYGQAQSERLCAQILNNDGFESIDPSHPLGGPDGKKDALCRKKGIAWIMAGYFPMGQQSFSVIKLKFTHDLQGLEINDAHGIAFITNQELSLSERAQLQEIAGKAKMELYHLERITFILDKPEMAFIRKQYLGIDFNEDDLRKFIKEEITNSQQHIEGLQTGGDTFCYWMLYHFEITNAVANNFVIIRNGKYPLYDLRMRICDMKANRDILNKPWGELNTPADYTLVKWPLSDDAYYRIFFNARNGSWTQDLQLKKSLQSHCWLAATIVRDRKGNINYKHFDTDFVSQFGEPIWSG